MELSLECITTNVERRNGRMLDSATTKRCAVRMELSLECITTNVERRNGR